MSTVTITGSLSPATNGYVVNAPDTDVVVTSSGSITVGAPYAGILIAPAGGGTVTNSGTLTGGDGVRLFSGGNTITNAATGHIVASSSGFQDYSAGGNILINDGRIDGTNYGIVGFNGSAGDHVENRGVIFSENEGIVLSSGNNAYVNNSGSVHPGDSIAVAIEDNSSETLINSGHLFGGAQFIGPMATVHNTGTIDGLVAFNGGANYFDGDGGIINGSIEGGNGNDTFDLSQQAVTGRIYGGLGDDAIIGTGSNDLIYGDDGMSRSVAGNDRINAGSGNDVVYGESGNDTIDGGAGNDILDGGLGADTLSYASSTAAVHVHLDLQGAIQFTIGAGNDTVSNFENLTGSSFNDSLTGDASGNVINGGAGNDDIRGGGGRDTLTGGAGNDTFVYRAASESTSSDPDTITDFTSGSDKIDLTALHLASASEIRILNNDNYTWVTVDVDGDGHSDMSIRTPGLNKIVMSDTLTGITSPAVAVNPVTQQIATVAVHHDLVASLHSAAVDHGLYG